MKNKIIWVLLVIFTIFIIVWFYIYYEKQNNIDNKKIVVNNIKTIEINEEKTLEEIKKEEITNKINNFKKAVASKWLIVSWDIHIKNDEYIFALQKFLKANKETPNNSKIISKIAETYFLMKNFSLSFKYSSKIEDTQYLDNNMKTLSFLYSENIDEYDFSKTSSWELNDWWNIFINEIKSKIKSFDLNKEEEFYYINSLDCISDFHQCKFNIQEYFKNTEYSWQNENLENIRAAISNYKDLKLDEIYYKNALIIWAFMKNKNYPLAIKLSEEILLDKPNYKPILKILAQSYFELNKLDKSNKYLLEYAKIDNWSPDISYMIWVIAQKNHDYIRSNIFLNLSIEQWYKNIEDIYRLQLYNYLILNKEDKISEIFDKIIAVQEKPEFNDLLLATYYNIINNNLDKAWLLTNNWIDLYPESEDFYWFKAWILIEKWDLEQASELLNKASKINPRNALIILNQWRISKIKYETEWKSFDKAKAKLLFKKAIEFDSAEIWDLAKKLLKELEEVKEN